MTEHKHRKQEDEQKNDQPEQLQPASDPAERTDNPEAEPKGETQSQVPMVALSMDEFTVLTEDKEKAEQQARDYLDGWQRERAEFQNYRRRVERDQAQISLNITGQIIKKYLVILDDLDRALKTRPTQGEGAAWSEGIDLIYRKLQTILESEGIERIPAEDQFFDPTIHEALTHEDSPNHQSGQIIEVVQQGYKIGDRVLRPALVRVAK